MIDFQSPLIPSQMTVKMKTLSTNNVGREWSGMGEDWFDNSKRGVRQKKTIMETENTAANSNGVRE